MLLMGGKLLLHVCIIQVGMQWFCTVMLICISLMTKKVEHLFICAFVLSEMSLTHSPHHDWVSYIFPTDLWEFLIKSPLSKKKKKNAL